MGFAHGFATGTQVGNSWINTYNDSKLKAGLAKAGDFEPTDVASGEDALQAGLKAKQFQLNQLNVDDPAFATKYKQVEDDHAPMMAGLEAQRAKSSSQMVQLPGGRRIEQDGEFSPEQMAGLRAEQSSKVYAQQGYPEEAAKSTLAAQGIAKNQTEQQKSAFELKALKRTEALHSSWEEEDLAHKEYLNPETPIASKEKYTKALMKRVLPMIDGNNPYLPGVVAKGMSKDGKEITIEQDGKTRTVPVSDALIQKAHMLVHLSRDPKTQAEYHMKMADRSAAEEGQNSRNDADNKTQVGIAQGNNAATIQAAKIRAADGGGGGSVGLTQEQNAQRVAALTKIQQDPTLTSEQKDDEMNRENMKWNAKATQLRETKPAAGLSVTDLGKIHEMVEYGSPPIKDEDPKMGIIRKRDAANRMAPGAGDQLYGPGQGNGFGNRPDGTAKANGHLGIIQGAKGQAMTEYSVGVNIGGKDMDIPTLVPGLTPQELNYIKNEGPMARGNPMADQIMQKAVAYAKTRIAQGKSPFASNAESPQGQQVRYDAQGNAWVKGPDGRPVRAQ